ncbi:FBP domain-containing protein [Solihabitans fulvus]|uniref:FBP domain-containing protein n=1 Tax=Solihabitans fulvus TaxID=1892852 RepID=A0A5B2WKF0_9PSEU|nr:FBP domain-containing protein [Solihabitans fulvus]KAA2250936.1 FBP domain-containing protein [Solihabitans fulvus]
MRPLTSEEIRKSFVNCTKSEVRSMVLPNEFDRTKWDELDFLGWRDGKAPNRGYVVLERDDTVLGIGLAANVSSRSRLKKNMCAFCVTTQDLASISLFAARRAGTPGRQGNTVGTYACADLRCCGYVAGTASPSVPQPHETLTTEERAVRMMTNLGRFVDKVLGTA